MFPAPKRSLQETNVYTRTHLLQVCLYYMYM